MKNKFVLKWMISFLMWTVGKSCPNPPDIVCHCQGSSNLNLVCNSKENNEKIFQAVHPFGYSYGDTDSLTLLCRNGEYIDDYLNVAIPTEIVSLKIESCLFTEKWARNFLNARIKGLTMKAMNYLPKKESIALFKMLPRLEYLSILEIMELNLTSDTFKYLYNLTYLEISSFNLQMMSQHPFVHLQNLRNLHFTNCKIKFLPDSTFQDLPFLEGLYLDENELKTLPETLLVKNLNLMTLKLENNKLTQLPQNLLQNAEDLRSLYMKNNPFKQIPSDIFRNNVKLFYVDLSECNLASIPENLFENVTNLKDLRIAGNKLKFITNSRFKSNTLLGLIDLSSNEISQLIDSPFQYNIGLHSIFLKGNKLENITRKDFSGLKSLRELDISDNLISDIEERSFRDLENLSRLHVNKNRLKFLKADCFKTNTLLSDLYLSFNEISQLIDSPFQHNTKLSTLLLNGNKLENMTSKDFSGLKLLLHLDISDNLISDIEEMSFQDLSNLFLLNVSKNRLKFLKVDFFKTNTLLNNLILSFNEISVLPNSPFMFNKELRILGLKGNKLSNISRSDFSGLTSLSTLDVSNNILTDIEEFSFEEMLLLKNLDISQNFLQEIPHLYHPSKTWGLSQFNANDNNITEFPNITRYTKLSELLLKRNQITSLSIQRNFFPETTNTYIYLQNNSIETINVDSIKFDHDHDYDYDDMINRPYLRKKVLFHFEGNPLICDCDLYEFNEYISRKVFCLHHVLFSDAHKLTCKGPQNLKGQIMHQLHRNNFVCPVTEKCPLGCSCTFRKSDSAVIMHCDGLDMNTLPEVIPENIRILHIENNRLKSLNELKREEWHNLTELYVDGNRLSAKTSAQWYIPRHLRVLSLIGNNLNILPEPIKRHAERMRNFQIYLKNNSWKCDCSGSDLRHWIHEHVEQVKDMNEILCLKDTRGGRSSTFQELMKLTHDSLCPFDHSPFIRKRILGASVILTLGFVCVVSMIFYNINKKKLLSYIYIHFPCFFEYLYNRDDLDSEKTFDAFISYSSDDRDVAIEISNELEKKEPYYRLCIHERDWMAGDYITENIVSSVESSRKTILIISKSFLESRWCDLEFEVAYNQTLKDKMSRLILIVKGDLPPKNTINDDMRFMLGTKTYITWGEEHFWEKLRSVLPYKFGERSTLV